MKIEQLLTLVFLVVALNAVADIPATDLPGAMRQGQKLFQKKLGAQHTNAAEIAEGMMHAYDKQHSQDIQIEFLSVKQLQRMLQARTNDLVPRLVFLANEITREEDCDSWFTALKEGYTLCTNEEQRVTCLALASISVLALEDKKFGKP